MPTYYKVLNTDGSAYHGGTGTWFLPHGKRPGKWMPAIPNPVPCERGYHVVTLEQLPKWLGPAIFEVEVRGASVRRDDKSVHEQARLLRRVEMWNERTARLFAVDCAEWVLPIFERAYPNDTRPRDCIGVARRYAIGDATEDELDAARAAAGAAARAAAWDAAWAAARDAARAAARAAAEAAARAAARDAAWEAAWAAARDAARAAARAAARDAAREVAREVARDAAWAAARDAARAAAEAAERTRQAERLGQYLRGEVA
jgi:hypothetical protein